MNNIKFSVTIPAYKQDYLAEAIESALQQTYSNLEVIVVDDCSPYDLKSIVARFSDPRVRYYRNEKNCGAIDVVDNWNICLGYATGDYVLCMGDDDRLISTCLAQYAALIEKYPKVEVFHGRTEIINERGEFVNLQEARPEWESSYSMAWHRLAAKRIQFVGDFLFRTSSLRAVGGFYKLPMAWGSDVITPIIIAKQHGIVNTYDLCFQYRQSSQTISKSGSAKIKIQALCLKEEWFRSFLSTPPSDPLDAKYATLLQKILAKSIEQKKQNDLEKNFHNGRFLSFFYWLFRHNQYKIHITTIVKALIKSKTK